MIGRSGVSKLTMVSLAGYQKVAIVLTRILYVPNEKKLAVVWKNLLLQYCELDTLAMIMIYWNWKEKLNECRLHKDQQLLLSERKGVK